MTALHRGVPVRGFLSPQTAALTGLTPPVPDVRGLSRDAAITALLRAGYRVTLDPATAPADAALPPGQVVAQDPVPGDRRRLRRHRDADPHRRQRRRRS